jgi:hypothetical protein|tara:strand:+ start:274 stop:501 length:228 start_codon:yes stop_codon:yes gene_type:complete
MHKLISFVIGGLLGLGLALTVNTVHDVTVDQSATIAAQAERIDKLEDGIERHLCFSAEIGDYTPSADLAARCAAR